MNDVYADPTHRKKCYNKGFYKLFNSKTAKRLGQYFASWVNQTKSLDIDEMRRLKNVPIMHAYGDHSLCCETRHDWCLASRAIKENKPYNHKPVFKVGVKKDEVRAQKAQEYHRDRA